MNLGGLPLQLLNGLADASALFLVASGLSLIFGVTRIINFAHGSFYMLGVYLAGTLIHALGATDIGYWLALPLAAILVGGIGGLVEIIVLRRIYRAPELFQLLATFAVVLIIGDLALLAWGPEDLFAPRAPGLSGSIEIFGRRFPEYDLFLIVVGPLVLGLLWLLLHRTRWGVLLRAAAENRTMLGALGVNQAWLFTTAFALGACLAGLGGALAAPRIPATLSLDLEIIASAFVVVVVGGLGSLGGAFLAALLICEVKALCIFIGQVDLWGWSFSMSKLTLVAEFIIMAIILVFRPWGLLGKPLPEQHDAAPLSTSQSSDTPHTPGRARLLRLSGAVLLIGLLALPWVLAHWPYLTILATEILIAGLFAASLYLLIGPAGLHTFGHAAWFGLGAYGAALLFLELNLPMEAALLAGPLVAAAGGLFFGWFCVRLSGVYLAMLTLATAQILWSLTYQWDGFTGGSNGLIGLWPSAWLSSPTAYYYLSLTLSGLGIVFLFRLSGSPLGYALRATRDSTLRAAALGMDTRRIQLAGFVAAALVAGLAGSVYAFFKGSIAPDDALSIGRSVDGLVMVILGGLGSLAGPLSGAAAYTWLHDSISRLGDYWHAMLGGIILLLIFFMPQGLSSLWARPGART